MPQRNNHDSIAMESKVNEQRWHSILRMNIGWILSLIEYYSHTDIGVPKWIKVSMDIVIYVWIQIYTFCS